MIKAIVFDMDGVLIEAKEWHYEALNKALGLFGYSISRHDHLTSFDGLPTSRKLEKLSVEQNLPMELHAFINEMKQQYTMEAVYSNCKPTFNHQYALSALKKQGYKIAVASNSIRNTVDIMMEKSGLDVYLDLKLSHEDVAKPKPAPDIYTRVFSLLGVMANECLVVEDNENGIKAAVSSGAHVLVVNDVSEVNLEAILGKVSQVMSEQ